MRAQITVYFTWGIFDYPSEGSEFYIGPNEDPKDFLNHHLSHYLLSPLDSFEGASVYKYNIDKLREEPIEIIRYKINRIKYNLTKQAEFILDDRISYL
jgi:hypothetical protein